MRLENHVEPERLRGLRHAQPRPLRRRFDVSGVADQLDGVGDCNGRDRRAGEGRGIDRARNQRGRDEWSRRVVDQNDVGLLAGEGFQTGMHEAWRVAPPFAGGAWRKSLTASTNIAMSSGFRTGCTAKTCGWRQNASMARKSRFVRRSSDTAWVLPRQRGARARLRQGWLQSVVVSALDSITEVRGREWLLAQCPYHAGARKQNDYQ